MFITARPLERSEWTAFRDMRLLSLKTDPGAFSGSYESWAAKTPAEWQDFIDGPGRKVIGLFDGVRLVGISGVVASRSDRTGKTAMLVMAFIALQYRGRGLAKQLYDARMDWVRAAGFTKVVVSHRESDEASRRANERHGFRVTKSLPRKWADGAEEDEVFHELRIITEAAA